MIGRQLSAASLRLRRSAGLALLVIAGVGGTGAATARSAGTITLRGAAFASPPDTFPHARHERLSCLACHETGTGHGRLTFEPPRGCTACHHRAPASLRCASCHRTDDYSAPRPVTVSVTVADRQERPRTVSFLHAAHLTSGCVECHLTPVTLAPPPDKAQCRDCHNEHHAVGRSCSSCHGAVEPRRAHETLEVGHQRCDACHTPTTIARLTPTRSFCLTCHAEQAKDHYVQRECSVCHFLAEPGVYRSKLVTSSSR